MDRLKHTEKSGEFKFEEKTFNLDNLKIANKYGRKFFVDDRSNQKITSINNFIKGLKEAQENKTLSRPEIESLLNKIKDLKAKNKPAPFQKFLRRVVKLFSTSALSKKETLGAIEKNIKEEFKSEAKNIVNPKDIEEKYKKIETFLESAGGSFFEKRYSSELKSIKSEIKTLQTLQAELKDISDDLDQIEDDDNFTQKIVDAEEKLNSAGKNLDSINKRIDQFESSLAAEVNEDLDSTFKKVLEENQKYEELEPYKELYEMVDSCKKNIYTFDSQRLNNLKNTLENAIQHKAIEDLLSDALDGSTTGINADSSLTGERPILDSQVVDDTSPPLDDIHIVDPEMAKTGKPPPNYSREELNKIRDSLTRSLDKGFLSPLEGVYCYLLSGEASRSLQPTRFSFTDSPEEWAWDDFKMLGRQSASEAESVVALFEERSEEIKEKLDLKGVLEEAKNQLKDRLTDTVTDKLRWFHIDFEEALMYASEEEIRKKYPDFIIIGDPKMGSDFAVESGLEQFKGDISDFAVESGLKQFKGDITDLFSNKISEENCDRLITLLALIDRAELLFEGTINMGSFPLAYKEWKESYAKISSDRTSEPTDYTLDYERLNEFDAKMKELFINYLAVTSDEGGWEEITDAIDAREEKWLEENGPKSFSYEEIESKLEELGEQINHPEATEAEIAQLRGLVEELMTLQELDGTTLDSDQRKKFGM